MDNGADTDERLSGKGEGYAPDTCCPFCLGRGRAYDPRSSPDPVEGNKMRSQVSCSACDGRGMALAGTPLAAGFVGFEVAYRLREKTLERANAELNRKRAEARRKLIETLTPEQRELLGINL